MRAVHHSRCLVQGSLRGVVSRVLPWVQYLFGVLLPLLLLTLLAAVLFLLAVFWAVWDLSLDLSGNRQGRHGRHTGADLIILPIPTKRDKLIDWWRSCRNKVDASLWWNGDEVMEFALDLNKHRYAITTDVCTLPLCAIGISLKVNETQIVLHRK